MKKKLLISAVILLSVLLIVWIVFGYVQAQYLERIDWILGKTSAEVEERYGEYYQGQWPGTGNCSFLLEEQRSGFLGLSPEWTFNIWFDANGVARRCYIERGPKGG